MLFVVGVCCSLLCVICCLPRVVVCWFVVECFCLLRVVNCFLRGLSLVLLMVDVCCLLLCVVVRCLLYVGCC